MHAGYEYRAQSVDYIDHEWLVNAIEHDNRGHAVSDRTVSVNVWNFAAKHNIPALG